MGHILAREAGPPAAPFPARVCILRCGCLALHRSWEAHCWSARRSRPHREGRIVSMTSRRWPWLKQQCLNWCRQVHWISIGMHSRYFPVHVLTSSASPIALPPFPGRPRYAPSSPHPFELRAQATASAGSRALSALQP